MKVALIELGINILKLVAVFGPIALWFFIFIRMEDKDCWLLKNKKYMLWLFAVTGVILLFYLACILFAVEYEVISLFGIVAALMAVGSGLLMRCIWGQINEISINEREQQELLARWDKNP